MIVMKKEPGENMMLTVVENNLKSLQEAVGGYIEAVTLAEDMAVLCDEEGLLKGKPYNCSFANIDFVGTVLVAGVDGEEFCDISAEAMTGFRKLMRVKK